jgi:alkaline phosphatase
MAFWTDSTINVDGGPFIIVEHEMIRGVGIKPLMEAIYDRLTTHALTSDYTTRNIVPRIVDGLSFPYVTMHSPTYAVSGDYSARDQEAEDIAVEIHVWSDRNSDSEAAEMMNNIARAMDSSALTITGYSYIRGYMDFGDIMVDDTESARPIRHGVIRYRFFIVPTS